MNKGTRIKKYIEADFRGFPGLVYQNTHQKSGPYRHMTAICYNISKPVIDIGGSSAVGRGRSGPTTTNSSGTTTFLR